MYECAVSHFKSGLLYITKNHKCPLGLHSVYSIWQYLNQYLQGSSQDCCMRFIFKIRIRGIHPHLIPVAYQILNLHHTVLLLCHRKSQVLGSNFIQQEKFLEGRITVKASVFTDADRHTLGML